MKKLYEDGFDIVSPEEMISKHRDDIVIIASRQHRYSLYDQLEFTGFPDERILNPRFGMIQAICGEQYFDFLKSDSEDEVFIDAGSYDGSTSVLFSKWALGYKRIYAWEANPQFREKCKNTFANNHLNNVEMIPYAAWNDKEILRFCSSQYDAGAAVSIFGDIDVQADSIDNIVADEEVTFIKMDIEGAEYKALEGAKNTIRNCRPKLAISIYHKPEDIIELPVLILRLCPDYQFAIRHYTSDLVESVLYAW